jgi:hypothetical protein
MTSLSGTLRLQAMDRSWTRFRAVALLAAGSIIVHELRYTLAYGPNAAEALAQQGHSYLPMVEALAMVLLGVAAVRFGMSLLRARSGLVVEARPPSFARLWLCATAALTAVFTLQEGFEGEFAAGHPGGLVGIFGDGGWTAILLAALVGAVIALLARVAHQAIELVARHAARPRLRPSSLPLRVGFRSLPSRHQRVLAWKLAGRAPPLT